MSYADKLDPLFKEWDKPDSPGCALAVVEQGKIVYARGYGMANLDYGIPITPASVFHIASISKQFTALAIALLEQDGRLAYTDDIRKFVPELPDYGTPITLQQLAQHTSGLRDQWDLLYLAGWREDDLKTNADVLHLAAHQQELNFPPGAEYLYSNTGYTLLALVVERVSGMSLRSFTTERIFKPLGMEQTHFHDDHGMIVPQRAYAYLPKADGGFRISIPNFDTVGATSLFSTVEDMARWANNFSTPVVGDKALLERMLKPGVLNDGEALEYGLGIAVGMYRGVRTFGHGGADAGYRADLAIFPDHDLAVVIFANLGTIKPHELTLKVVDILLEDQLQPETKPLPVMLDEANFQKLVGLYQSVQTLSTYQFEVREGKPVIPIVPGFDIELTPLSHERFAAIGWGFEVWFIDDPSPRMEIRSDTGGGKPSVFTRVEAASPTAEQLHAYAGTYRSDELDTAYAVVIHDDQIGMTHVKHGSYIMQPTVPDGFVALAADLRANLLFTRAADGSVTGFDLSTGRVRKQHFTRQARS